MSSLFVDLSQYDFREMGERINVPICQHLYDLKKTYLGDHRLTNSGTPNIGTIQTSAAEVWQLMFNEVSLFQVAEVPTNMYDYTLPKAFGKNFSSKIFS